MGIFKAFDIILRNEFPDNTNHSELLAEFYAWMDDETKNAIFVYSNDSRVYLDLCNNERVMIDTILEYWAQHIKKGIHNGEGFVIKG